MKFTVKFRLERETPNTIRYNEVDDKGEPAGAWSKLGTLYVKKTTFERGAVPRELVVTVTA